MNRADWVTFYAKNSGISKVEAKKRITEFETNFSSAILAGNTPKIDGVLTPKFSEYSADGTRDPRTGENDGVPVSFARISFKPSSTIKKAVKDIIDVKEIEG